MFGNQDADRKVAAPAFFLAADGATAAGVAADISMTVRDRVVHVYETNGAVQADYAITLPPVAEAAGLTFSFTVVEDISSYPVTIQDQDESFDWTDIVLTANNEHVLLYSDGRTWQVIKLGLVRPLLTQVDSAAVYNVGRRFRDELTGSEYIYLQGITSVVLGDWVHFLILTTAGSTTARATANGKGPLAVAMAAIVAAKFGWFQIAGYTTAAGAISGGDCAVGAALYLTSTAGLVDDVFVDGDMIFGAVSTVQEGESPAGVALIGAFLSYPTTNDLDIVS